jgi:hypothetical protein
MTTLETRTHCHPPIPLANVSPLEMLILTNVLECSKTETGLILFTDFGPTNPIRVARSELIAAFHASAQYAGDLNTFIVSRVLALLPAGGNTVGDDAMIDIDLSQFPWQFLVQGIVARSPHLREVSVIQWMNHPSQRPESFGASVSLITAKAIHHATSEDLLARFRLQDKALPLAASSVALPEDDNALAGDTASDLFTVKEIETALCIWEAMLYFRGLHQDERPVQDNIARMSEVWDAVGWQAMRSHVRAIVPFALDVHAAVFGDLEEEGFTFDFDFAPALIETLRWSEDGADLEGEPKEFLEDVMVAVKRRRQDVVAQTASGFDRSPADRRVCGSRQPRDIAFRDPPDPWCDLGSRLDHLRKRLFKFFSGACRHDEHGDGSRFLFGQCHRHDRRIAWQIETQAFDALSLEVAEPFHQPKFMNVLKRQPVLVDHHQGDLFDRRNAGDRDTKSGDEDQMERLIRAPQFELRLIARGEPPPSALLDHQWKGHVPHDNPLPLTCGGKLLHFGDDQHQLAGTGTRRLHALECCGAPGRDPILVLWMKHFRHEEHFAHGSASCRHLRGGIEKARSYPAPAAPARPGRTPFRQFASLPEIMQHRPQRQFPGLAADAMFGCLSRRAGCGARPALGQRKVQLQVGLAVGIDLDRLADQRAKAGKLVRRLIRGAGWIVIASR